MNREWVMKWNLDTQGAFKKLHACAKCKKQLNKSTETIYCKVVKSDSCKTEPNWDAQVLWHFLPFVNPWTPELSPSTQRCLTRFLTGDFASWTVNFVNICVKNQQIQQLFIQFINYAWQVLHVSALHCHLQGAFLVPSERCSIEEQSTENCRWACCV
jgi:hypothetical protein